MLTLEESKEIFQNFLGYEPTFIFDRDYDNSSINHKYSIDNDIVFVIYLFKIRKFNSARRTLSLELNLRIRDSIYRYPWISFSDDLLSMTSKWALGVMSEVLVRNKLDSPKIIGEVQQIVMKMVQVTKLMEN